MGLTSGRSNVLPLTRFPFTEFTRFFDDIELLRQRWQSANTESVAELWANPPPSSWRNHLIIVGQAHRFLQILLSRVFIQSGSGVYPRWPTEEGRQGLVN